MKQGVELTVDGAWYIAEHCGAGPFPWVLAITPPYSDAADRSAFLSAQIAQLTEIGVMADNRINSDVQQWIRTVCFPQRWLELRIIGSSHSSTDMLRGILAQSGPETAAQTVVALRNAQFVTFTPVAVDDPHDIARLVTVGMPNRFAARFEKFTLPVRVGERADRALREGADLARVMEYLGVPESARGIVRAVLEGPSRYVEVMAGQRGEASRYSTEVGIAVFDTTAGRVLVSPTRAFDGEWISTFAPGTTSAIARAVEQLNASLPDGPWFPEVSLNHQFTTQAF